ncbi:hypothetical protein [Pseudoduganella lutea]|uniref:Uncharacterized protein n=1 Tax=Pseudoduganella lutea TaxID=321985 RepID=A0A4P6KSL1_9BURK|nr:hypothetical protein [Pseudoduganella lutea]QBE61666.1 hypothetical protein EWM63_00485 [Pseudoduganella lutea]
MKNVNSVQGLAALPVQAEQAMTHGYVKMVKRVSAWAILAMLGAYAVQLMNSAVEIGVQEKNLIIAAVVLTLVLVIPIIAVNVYFVSRHRTASTTARNSPRSSHAIKKALMAWATPIVVVALVAFVGWLSIHSLDLCKPMVSQVVPERVATVPGA